jgi:membrane-associated phospholipid phosphatase
MTFRSPFAVLSPVDVVSIAFLFFLTLLNIFFQARVEHWFALTTVNVAAVAGIVLLASFAHARDTKLLIGLHRWYCYPFVILVFKELYLMVHPINPVDNDALLIAADRWLFGVNPTQWAFQFAHPFLTEILQAAYFSYYLLFILLGVELYRRYPIEEFDNGAFLIVYGFYLSYLGYFILPAIGPRFTLHDFYALPRELPGLWATDWMRNFVNAGESISFAMPNAAAVVQRDVFPSGHTQLTLIVTSLAFHYKLPVRWVIAVLATLLIISTIYLRYHYVVDLLGGSVFSLLTIWSGRWMQKKMERMRG